MLFLYIVGTMLIAVEAVQLSLDPVKQNSVTELMHDSSALQKGRWDQISTDDCWFKCGKKGGLCEDVCSSNGYCCRKGFDDCPSEAGKVSPIRHTCVKYTDTGLLLGPGNGRWQTTDPESEGLSSAMLDAAEAATNNAIPGRECYLVIKNGRIVKERYRGVGGINHKRHVYSCTKSMCGSLYGIAVRQGWANVNDKVADRNSGTRACNKAAEFRHVLTMTGQSSNISNPKFSYDAIGVCLDSINDFISQNNPGGLSAYNWKNKFWRDILGIESMSWGWSWGNSFGHLGCGFGSVTTCRDLARVAQLYLNDGEWPGVGQVMDRSYAQDARKQMIKSGSDYGYTLWLGPNDPVDPEVYSMNGMYDNCAYISKKHQAIIVTMGSGDPTNSRCGKAWKKSRDAIITNSERHLYNITNPSQLVQEREAEEGFARNFGVPHEEIVRVGTHMLSHQDQFMDEDIKGYKKYLSDLETNSQKEKKNR